MLLDLIKRMSVALSPRHSADDAYRAAPAKHPQEAPLVAVLGETSWHGDHWANLLSSPMDARHYVLEDWSTPRAAAGFET
jgi:hypothetical protein